MLIWAFSTDSLGGVETHFCSTAPKMRAIADWLQRLSGLEPEHELGQVHCRVFVPGTTPLDVDGWLLTTFPQPAHPQAFKSGAPETMSVVRIVDRAENVKSMFDVQRLLAELSALLSLALDRRIEIPFEISTLVQGTGRLLFTPYGQLLDRTILGPLPKTQLPAIAEVLAKVSTMSPNDVASLGDATSLLHAAMLIFDQEPRSAYTLLIAALEVLSRTYGSPPTDWRLWEDAQIWDERFNELSLSALQAEGLRSQLMDDRHLRLRATFRSYCAERPGDNFWEREYTEWLYPLNARTGTPTEPTISRTRRVADTLPRDRDALAGCLGHSYDLRSRFVHRGHWVGPTDLTLLHDGAVDPKNPLPFNLLRQLVEHLIMREIDGRSSVGSLPNVQLFRAAPGDAA